jgi:hypothetical protein
MIKRYQQTIYESYFQSETPRFPVDPLPSADGLGAMARVVAVTAGDTRGVYALSEIARRADGTGTWSTRLDGTPLRFQYRAEPQTVVVFPETGRARVEIVYAFWFAWHAMYPNDKVASE